MTPRRDGNLVVRILKIVEVAVMRRDSLVMFASCVLAVALASSARADDRPMGKGIEDPARVGRPGEGMEHSRAGGKADAKARELSGTVVKVDSKTLYLEHMGAIVPLKIDEKTRFSGDGLSSSRDLVEGKEVRASFTIENGTTNVAERISLAGSSGSGGRPEQMPPGRPPIPGQAPGTPPDRQPMPRDPGRPAPTEPGGPAIPKY